jgi:hypothetical protein
VVRVENLKSWLGTRQSPKHDTVLRAKTIDGVVTVGRRFGAALFTEVVDVSPSCEMNFIVTFRSKNLSADPCTRLDPVITEAGKDLF